MVQTGTTYCCLPQTPLPHFVYLWTVILHSLTIIYHSYSAVMMDNYLQVLQVCNIMSYYCKINSVFLEVAPDPPAASPSNKYCVLRSPLRFTALLFTLYACVSHVILLYWCDVFCRGNAIIGNWTQNQSQCIKKRMKVAILRWVNMARQGNQSTNHNTVVLTLMLNHIYIWYALSKLLTNIYCLKINYL